MALKNNWANGDTFTPAAANDMADAVNARASSRGYDLRDWPDVLAANWYTVSGLTITSGSATVTNTPFTAADIGKVAIFLYNVTSSTDSRWWKTTITAVSGTTATMSSTSPGTRTTSCRYGFDGTSAINNALAEISARSDSPAEVYIGGSYRLSQLILPNNVVLRGVRWTTNGGEYWQGKTALTQLPGSNKDFVVFRPFSTGSVWTGFQGLTDLAITGPEVQVYGIDDSLSRGNGVAFFNPTVVSFTGNTSSGSTAISSVSAAPSFDGLYVGGTVTGTGIPVGTRITAVNYPSSAQIQISKAATATASAVALTSAPPINVQDNFEISRISVSKFPENGFLVNGAVPGYFNELLATACGGYGFAYIASNPTTTQAAHLLNFSADYNNLGAVLLEGLSSYSAFVITNLKSESFVDADGGGGLVKFGANQPWGAPNGQKTAIVLNNCDKAPVLINGVSHIRGAGVSGPGPAITIRDTSGNSRKPKVVFNAVATRVVGTETGSIADSVALRDEISSVDIPRDTSSGVYPTMSAPPYIVDNFAKPILRFREYSAGTAQSHLAIYNAPTGTPPIIQASDTDGSVTNIDLALQPSGTGRVQILGTTPGIVGGASGNANLNLQSRGTGKVQINGVEAATISSNITGTAANVTATVSVTNGGTGATTLTGLVKGSGTSALTAATAGTDYADPAIDVYADALTTGESTILRRQVSASNVSSSSGLCRWTYFTARKSETITQVRVPTGSTAAAGATICRIGIYTIDGSGNLTLAASTANDTALWAAAGTAYTKSLSASFSKVRGTRYAVGLIFVGTTAPTFCGINSGMLVSESGLAPRLAAYTGSLSDLPSSMLFSNTADTTTQSYSVLLP